MRSCAGPGLCSALPAAARIGPGTHPSPAFLRAAQAVARGGSATPQQPQQISHCPDAFGTQRYNQTSVPSACLLSHCRALNSRYWVAAQKILFCQKAYYIQLDVWNVNLFGLKHP